MWVWRCLMFFLPLPGWMLCNHCSVRSLWGMTVIFIFNDLTLYLLLIPRLAFTPFSAALQMNPFSPVLHPYLCDWCIQWFGMCENTSSRLLAKNITSYIYYGMISVLKIFIMRFIQLYFQQQEAGLLKALITLQYTTCWLDDSIGWRFCRGFKSWTLLNLCSEPRQQSSTSLPTMQKVTSPHSKWMVKLSTHATVWTGRRALCKLNVK